MDAVVLVRWLDNAPALPWALLVKSLFSRHGQLDLGADRIHQDFGRSIARVDFAFHDDDLTDGQFFAVLFPGAREKHQLDIALDVFDGGKPHRLAGLGHIRADDG